MRTDDGFDGIADAVREHGWQVVPAFLSPAAVSALAADCRARDAAGELAAAATGRAQGRALSELRGDRTRWFDETALSPAQRLYWDAMQALRQALNRRLLLGLETLEAHYALYPPGTGYARHRDRFRDSDARVLSSVLYLNRDWRPDDGGALRLHLPDGPHDVAPLGGTLALFLSADVEHEVLPATRERMSIAGWFRRREAA
ncbi:MAG TPA: 2OG-Fe(II) oxygenase [Tahibacter sp.]|uniref:2OG-Fe(II) oxygenase n=1 Tax=Tahibacter sp. TaxID=2056211 RepID=UPI002CEE3E94|nr:2OG-Fe(II) oxygenase [Tahibacter sp.]HSX59598.1 2OG-Fe(II) oxygenase [Tahibacter sp.]